jgi:hypothetical protein
MDNTLKADGFDEAFLGVATQCCGRPDVLVYDYDKAIRLLQTRDKMTQEEAMEYMDFNVLGAWVGTGTPMFLKQCSLKEAIEYLEEENGAD